MFKLVQSITTLSSTAAYANKAKFLIYFYWLQTTHWNSNFISAKKMVVLTSHLLSDAHRYILRCLASHQAISHCTIFTSISEVLIYKAFSNNYFTLLVCNFPLHRPHQHYLSQNLYQLLDYMLQFASREALLFDEWLS